MAYLDDVMMDDGEDDGQELSAEEAAKAMLLKVENVTFTN